MSRKHIYLLHGKGGSPNGSVLQLEHELRPHLAAIEFARLLQPHSDPNIEAARSLEFLQMAELQEGATIIGISLGGLIAAKLQESGRKDLKVFCISSPTWADTIRLEKKMPNRIAFYSSQDEVIAGRTEDWPKLAEAHDLPWLTHNTDAHKVQLAEMILKHL